MREYGEDNNDFFEESENEDTSGIVRKFEDMLRLNITSYFDVDEFVAILNFYIIGGKTDLANRAVKIAMIQHPNSPEIQIKNPQVLLEQEKAAEALKVLKIIEERFGQNFEIFLLRGLAFIQMGNIKEADHQFRKSLASAPEDEKVEISHSIASHFIAENEYKLALKYLLKAYRLKSDNDNLIFDIAFCYEKLERYAQGIQFYEKCLDLNPFSEYAWFNLGIIYNTTGDYEKAIECYDFATAVNENYLGAYLNKANTLVNLDRFDEAIEVYKSVLEVDEGNIYALYYIGECYEKLDDSASAESYYHKTLEIDNEFGDAWLGLAILKNVSGDYEQSLKYIEAALKTDDLNPDYWFTFAKTQLKLNNLILAITGFWRATESDPYDIEAWLELSTILYQEKRFREAIQILEYANEFEKDNSQFLYRLAAFNFLAGKNKKGYDWLEKALKSYPELLTEFYKFFPKGRIIKGIAAMVQNFGGSESLREKTE